MISGSKNVGESASLPKPTATSVALDIAVQARTDPAARLNLPLAIDLAWLELVKLGAIQAADQVVQRCLLLANYSDTCGHLSASGGHLSG